MNISAISKISYRWCPKKRKLAATLDPKAAATRELVRAALNQRSAPTTDAVNPGVDSGPAPADESEDE